MPWGIKEEGFTINWVFIGIKALRYSWNIIAYQLPSEFDERLTWYLTPLLITCLGTGSPACSTRKFIFCGTGILPVLHNGATSRIDRTSGNFSSPVVSKTIACLVAGNNRRKIWIYPSASPRRWNLATTNRCIFGNCRTIHQGWVFNFGFDVGIIGESFPRKAGCDRKGDRPQVFEARWAIVFSYSYI